MALSHNYVGCLYRSYCPLLLYPEGEIRCSPQQICFLIVFSYLLLLFGLAYLAEKREKKGKSIVNNPYIYSLSLAVYCTSWTFYGSVGKAATSGLSFITTYIGPTLMACLWPVILTKVIRLAKTHRITTISDFISSRYGKSLFLSGLVTVVAVAGITPYLGLQIKAIISTFSIISGETKGSAFAGLFFYTNAWHLCHNLWCKEAGLIRKTWGPCLCYCL
jgi:Na+/proline symporter